MAPAKARLAAYRANRPQGSPAGLVDCCLCGGAVLPGSGQEVVAMAPPPRHWLMKLGQILARKGGEERLPVCSEKCAALFAERQERARVQRERLAEEHRRRESRQPLIQRPLYRRLAKLALLLILFRLALEFGLGYLYVVMAGFYVAWSCLDDSSPPREGELSAFSVFNPKFQKLPGTFDAEQIDESYRKGKIV